jgi:hypothetical protein
LACQLYLGLSVMNENEYWSIYGNNLIVVAMPSRRRMRLSVLPRRTVKMDVHLRVSWHWRQRFWNRVLIYLWYLDSSLLAMGFTWTFGTSGL